MYIVNSHILNHHTKLLMGECDKYGNLHTRIVEGKGAILVEKTPLKVLDKTLNCAGFDLRGAIVGARSILGKRSMCPIIVNPLQGLCMFPSKSPAKDDCLWFNPKHIVDTTAICRQTNVEMSDHLFITIDLGLTAFNNKIQLARRLLAVSTENGTNPSTELSLKTKKEYQIVREDNGRYNFDALTKVK